MIRLNLDASEFRWIDFPGGSRIKVRPMESWMRTVAQERAVTTMPLTPQERAYLSKPGADLLTSILNEPLQAAAGRHQRASLMLTYLAILAIVEWEGFGDAAGNPIPVSETAVIVMMRNADLFRLFVENYLNDSTVLDAEKNASAPAPTGISEAGTDTAENVEKTSTPAPKDNPSEENTAPTTSTGQ